MNTPPLPAALTDCEGTEDKREVAAMKTNNLCLTENPIMPPGAKSNRRR